TLVAGLENGFTLSDSFTGSAQTFQRPGGGTWTPKNYGGASYGQVTLLKATQSSINRTPHFVVEVVNPEGESLYKPDTKGERKFDKNVMAETTYALSRVVQGGSGSYASNLGRPVAGKTGTSNESKSAWFVGYTPQLATA
ncbi:penicillin-binding transpeptidase domain-containing protein, partial [Brevibacterium paucivorans]